jgi:hypothetical protein
MRGHLVAVIMVMEKGITRIRIVVHGLQLNGIVFRGRLRHHVMTHAEGSIKSVWIAAIDVTRAVIMRVHTIIVVPGIKPLESPRKRREDMNARHHPLSTKTVCLRFYPIL